jgi:hypothetical protein
MAVTWNVLGIRKLATEGSLSNVCKFIDWECKDSETVDDKLLRGYVCSDVVLSAADSSSFVAYADITSDMAVTWVKNILGTEKVAKIEAEVTRQITEQKTPTYTTGVPW